MTAYLTEVGGELTEKDVVPADVTGFDEAAQDAVGTILVDTPTIDLTYNDATPSITAAVIAGSIGTTQLANDGVTFAKMQNIATDSLIGRDTTGTGDPEQILLNATLSMDGSNNLQRAALTGDVTASAGSNSTTIATNAVSFAKFQQIATDRLLGRDTAGTGNVEELTVSGGVEFTGTGIQTSAFTGDVTKAAGGTATTIANDAVTNAKLANMPAHTIKGNNTAGSADPIDLTLVQVAAELNISGTNTGDQNLFVTITGNSGSAVADNTADTLTVTGTGQASTTAASTPDTLVISVPLLSGPVTSVAGGATTITNDAVTNAKLDDVPTATFKGRTTAGTGDPEDLTVAQAKTLLNLAGTNTGDQTITLTGDVTGSGTGSFAATIANDAVSFAKMQNIATDSLIGRDTAGTGDPEQILLNGTLSMDGSGNLQRAALTGDVTATAGSNATTIANDAVTNAKLANMPTLTIKGNNTGGTADPIDLTVAQVNTMLGSSSSFGVVTGNTGTATADTPADSIAITGTGVISTAAGDGPETLVISSAALTGDVTTSGAAATIANNAVTYAKMQDIPTDSLIGRDTAASGDPETITLGASLSMNGSQVLQRAALTGDVTAAVNSNSTTIAADAVTNTQLANMAQSTFKMRAAGAGTGDPIDGTVAQAKTALAYTAADVANVAAGTISATDVQAALNELDTEKVPLSATVFTNSIQAQATSGFSLTTTVTDVAGATVTFTTQVANTVVMVMGVFDFSYTGTASNDIAVGTLNVDGTDVTTHNAIFQFALNVSPGVNIRMTAAQNWRITLPTAGSHTLKLRASKTTAGTGNTYAIVTTHTGISVTGRFT